MESFTKLGLSKELTNVLKRLGFEKPSEIQEKTIPLALAGKDIIGGSATGSGKTLAFSSAIIENLSPNGKVQALILTPTRELADQVAKSIRVFSENKNLEVLAIYGGVRIDTQMRKISRADVVVGTPGRIMDHMNRRTLNFENLKFLVLDEVDRMFDMGFRKDVERIISVCPKKRQTMLFSATISPDIDYLAKKYTSDPIEVAVKSQVDPSKLKQVYYDVQDNKKFSLLVHLLKEENSDLVMVFCNTRRNVEFIVDNLNENGIHAKAIHGGIEQKKRIRVLEEFHKKGLGVLVCTDVAARGLDIQGVSHVYNYDVPADSKEYIHRIGRTARAGKDGKAIVILASRDYENFGMLTRSKEIFISSEKLPQFERANMKKMPVQRRSFGGSRSRDSSPRRGNFSRGRRSDGDSRRKPFNRNSSRRNDSPRGRRSDGRSRDSSPRRGNFSRGRRN